METSGLASGAIAPVRPRVASATAADVREALRAGLADLAVYPALSLFFGLVYALFGAALIAGLLVLNQVWVVIPVALGFPLVAPFLAAGLYEMSRRIGEGERFSALAIFGVIFNQRRRQFGWMAFVVLFVFWIWAYQVRIVLAITLQNQTFGSLPDLATVILTTTDGAIFLIVGSIIGAVLSTILFSVTVLSMPLLLDKEVDFVTAIITSVKAVHKSPVVMIGWGAVIGAATLISIATAFIGVIVVFPILGHAAWHLYRRLVSFD